MKNKIKNKKIGKGNVLTRENKKINWKVFIFSLLIVYAVAGIGSSFTKIDSWYESIKPALAPPGWVFGVVWTFLFYLIAIAMYYSWTNSNKKEKKKVFSFYAVNLILNMLWSFIYFKAKNPAFALVVLIVLWCSILALIIMNWKINKKASYLLIPYLLWVSFASILNILSIK